MSIHFSVGTVEVPTDYQIYNSKLMSHDYIKHQLEARAVELTEPIIIMVHRSLKERILEGVLFLVLSRFKETKKLIN